MVHAVHCPQCGHDFRPHNWEQREQEFNNYLANRKRYELDARRHRTRVPKRQLDIEAAAERYSTYWHGQADAEIKQLLLDVDLPAMIKEVRRLEPAQRRLTEILAAIDARDPSALARATRSSHELMRTAAVRSA